MEQYLIEVSSEAGRKVGGIYTVLLSKARYISEAFPKNYLLIGFYDERCVHDIKFEQPPKEYAQIFKGLSDEGIMCHFGRWTYAYDLPIISVDAKIFGEKFTGWADGTSHVDRNVNFAKYQLWKNFGIDSLMESSPDFSENVVWGWAVGMLLEKMSEKGFFKGKSAVAQFHEWISGAALLYCKSKRLPLATVFTTHATVLGRSLAAGGVDVLAAAERSKKTIELSEAYRLKVEGKHQLEVQAAKNADVFTTVSETVGKEVKYILGRAPDIVTINGMDFEQAEKESSVRDLSNYSRRELLQLLEACFISYYPQRYDKALLTFISGRYEFTNKGFDIYISAMGKLNARLKEKKASDRRIFAFIFAPSSVKGPKISVIKNYLLLDKIHEMLGQVIDFQKQPYVNLQEHLNYATGNIRNDLDAMSSGFMKDGERPHINLFDLNYPGDEIIRSCISAGLTNSKDDVVKIIFYPTYLRPNDGLMNMNYYDVIGGMDVGIFPSRYEPFGYTPLEAGLKMDIAVSSDTSGFGYYLKHNMDLEGRGVKILSMSGKSASEAASELAKYLEGLYAMDEGELGKLKEDSYSIMKTFDWKKLSKNYLDAYSLAQKRAIERKLTEP